MAWIALSLWLFATALTQPVAAAEVPRPATLEEIRGLLAVPSEIRFPWPEDEPRETARLVGEISRFYVRRGFEPAWDRAGRLQDLILALEGLVDDGLDARDYGADRFGVWLREIEHAQQPNDAALREVVATGAYLRALGHLVQGRVDPRELGLFWNHRETDAADREFVLGLAAEHLDHVESAFARARPAIPLYAALRAELARLRAAVHEGPPDWVPIPAGPALREGSVDSRVTLVRARLSEQYGMPSAPAPRPERYDAHLGALVRDFQRAHGLQVDGVVGRETLRALNSTPAQRIGQARANLERLRWLGPGLEERAYVLVDLVRATVQVIREGEILWHARVQVGRPERPSPSLRSEITHLTFNPTWTVPPTILRNDTLPAIRRDPGYLERNHMRVLDSAGRELPPDQVDWARPGGILLRQDAGPFNALGKVAFRFPNPFHVYLHDTPSQGHFASERRTYSSGCVRVQKAGELVEFLIEAEFEGRRELARDLYAGESTREFRLERPVPILLVYWTAEREPAGGVRFLNDVYGRDAALAALLASDALGWR